MVLNKFNLDYWNCELNLSYISGTPVDASGNNVTVSNIGTPTYIRTPDSNIASYISGSTQGFSVPNTTLIPRTSDFTIAVWLKFPTAAANHPIYVADNNSSPYFQWATYDANRLDFYYGASVTPASTVTDVFTDNIWAFCVVSKSGTTAHQYINGVLKDSTTTVLSDSNVTYGTATIFNGLTYNKALYGGRLWFFNGTALTQAQIKALYNATYIS